MVVTSAPMSRAAMAVYPSPVQMSSTLAPARSRPSAHILRAVSSLGSTPLPNLRPRGTAAAPLCKHTRRCPPSD
eukprot:1195447-Prorocentrum_minimum.AAC.2